MSNAPMMPERIDDILEQAADEGWSDGALLEHGYYLGQQSVVPPEPVSPPAADVVEFDADGEPLNLCSVCGTPVRYGSRHHKCGRAVMAEVSAALAAAAGTAWHPVATPPPDQQHVLCYWLRNRFDPTNRSPACFSVAYIRRGEWFDGDDDESFLSPDFWRLLPPSPEAHTPTPGMQSK